MMNKKESHEKQQLIREEKGKRKTLTGFISILYKNVFDCNCVSNVKRQEKKTNLKYTRGKWNTNNAKQMRS